MTELLLPWIAMARDGSRKTAEILFRSVYPLGCRILPIFLRLNSFWDPYFTCDLARKLELLFTSCSLYTPTLGHITQEHWSIPSHILQLIVKYIILFWHYYCYYQNQPAIAFMSLFGLRGKAGWDKPCFSFRKQGQKRSLPIILGRPYILLNILFFINRTKKKENT